MIDRIREINGNDSLMVFGQSGSGKTTFALSVCEEALKEGKKVLYIDTERNIVDKDKFKFDYVYTPSFDGCFNKIMSIRPGYSVVVLDSLGLPVLGEYATLDLKRRGEILLKAESISYALKKYSAANNTLVVVTNQPVSCFGKEKGTKLDPFGDKSRYFYKEIWESEMLSSNPTTTVCAIKTFRSRKYGIGQRLFKLTINASGVNVE